MPSKRLLIGFDKYNEKFCFRYPFLLHEECFISALQTIVTFVIRYKLLLWNPILPLKHSSIVEEDKDETFFLTPSYKSLSNMACQLRVMIEGMLLFFEFSLIYYSCRA
jgi:hypothetical protein